MIIQRLNMDNAWWVQLGKVSFLIDPWLMGSEIDYFKWFNQQWLKAEPVNIDDVPQYDFVVITQKYPDHFHEETLVKLQPQKLIVPKARLKKTKQLFPKAEVLILEKNHSNVFGTDLNFHFFPTKRKIDPIYDALLVENGEKSVFIATHGFNLNEKQLQTIKDLPEIELLMCPFNYYKLPALLGGLVSPGTEAAGQLLEQIKGKKIVATHDEDKIAKGMVSKFAKIKWAQDQSIAQQDIFKNKFIHIQDYNPVSI